MHCRSDSRFRGGYVTLEKSMTLFNLQLGPAHKVCTANFINCFFFTIKRCAQLIPSTVTTVIRSLEHFQQNFKKEDGSIIGCDRRRLSQVISTSFLFSLQFHLFKLTCSHQFFISFSVLSPFSTWGQVSSTISRCFALKQFCDLLRPKQEHLSSRKMVGKLHGIDRWPILKLCFCNFSPRVWKANDSLLRAAQVSFSLLHVTVVHMTFSGFSCFKAEVVQY